MADLADWPDPHFVLFELLADLNPNIIGPRLHPEFEKSLPLTRVRCIGGGNDKVTDYPRVVVDVYAPSYEAARDLAEAIRQRLLDAPHATSAGVLDNCETESRPFELPYPDPTVRQFTATYRLSLRR